MGWVSPTGFVDPSIKWNNEALAYDEDTGTYATTDASVDCLTWSSYLELTHSAISCDKVQIYSGYPGSSMRHNQVDVYYSNDWHNIFDGDLGDNAWTEISLGSTQLVTKARIRIYNKSTGYTYKAGVYEFDFNIPVVAPTVTTQAVSDIAPTTATGNGNKTDTGGEDASAWGVCVAETENPDIEDTVFAGSGAGGVGAFTAAMTGLTPGEHYYVRAYATNSAGTGYGEQVDFTTGVTHLGATTLSGTGTLAGIGRGTFIGASTLSGVGTLAGIARLTAIGKSTLSGTGTLAGIGSFWRYGKTTLSGAGTLVGAAVITAIGKATLAGTGTLAGKAVITAIGKATLSGVGTLATIGTRIRILLGKATLTGSGTLVAAGRLIAIGKAVLAGTGSLAAIGTRIRFVLGKATLSGVGTLAAILTLSVLRRVRDFTGRTVQTFTGRDIQDFSGRDVNDFTGRDVQDFTGRDIQEVS